MPFSPSAWGGRPCWAEIDVDALGHNVGAMVAHASPARLYAVVKANAYGHGAVAMALEAVRAGAAALAVVCVDEAEGLRRAGVAAPIVLVGYTPPSDAGRIVSLGLEPTVASPELCDALTAAGLDPARCTVSLRRNGHKERLTACGRSCTSGQRRLHRPRPHPFLRTWMLRGGPCLRAPPGRREALTRSSPPWASPAPPLLARRRAVAPTRGGAPCRPLPRRARRERRSAGQPRSQSPSQCSTSVPSGTSHSTRRSVNPDDRDYDDSALLVQRRAQHPEEPGRPSRPPWPPARSPTEGTAR